MFPEGEEHLWEDTGNLTVSQVEDTLLKHAQSPKFAQHIILKPYDLSKEMLQDIANKPYAIIISADGSLSTVCSSLAVTQIPQAEQEVTCRVELAYNMDEGLQAALKSSAATSVVHTVGQQVFLHNFDCKGGTGTVTIRVTEAELKELALFRQQKSSATLGTMSKELNRQQSLSAVSLSDLIDSALQLYGIPAMAVKRISGSRNVATLAPFFARELHPDRVDGGHLMLIGDAAMRVEFWPGKGINTAFATAQIAVSCLLSSMTTEGASQPQFELTPMHLQEFSRQMTDVADHFGATNLLPVPAASSRWSAVAAMTAEDVVHKLMAQICERGTTAVEHLWPMLPSHMLIETRLRQLIPDKVHVVRRMLRDGPWPGEGAKVMAPLTLAPLPPRQTQLAPIVSSISRRAQEEDEGCERTVLSSSLATVPSPQLSKAPQSSVSRHGDTSPTAPLSRHGGLSRASPLSRHNDISPATPLSRHERAASHPHSPCHCVLHAMHSPSISSAAPVRTAPSQQRDVAPVRVPRKHVSMESASDQSASGQSLVSELTSHSTGSSHTVDSRTLSDIEAKIAVLTKWGQPLPHSPELLLPESASSCHAKGPASWLRSKKHDVSNSGRLRVSISHVDSAPHQHLVQGTQLEGNSDLRSGSKAAALPAESQIVSKQQAGKQSETMSQSVPMSPRAATSGQSQCHTPSQQSPRALHHPQHALPVSQGQMPQLQPAPLSSRDPPTSTHRALEPHHSPSLQGSQESQGRQQAAPSPQAQSPLQMWPHVRKYAVPQPLKAVDSSIQPQTPLPSQTHRRANSQPASQQRSVGSIQPQMPLPSQTHRRAYSQPASQPQSVVTSQPEARIKVGNIPDDHAPEWVEQGTDTITNDGAAVGNQLWRTPQLPSEWSGQGNPLFGWWELGSAIVGDVQLDPHQPHSSNPNPAAPSNAAAAVVAQDAAPFALVAQR
ncbi:hypothetical protein ABBQ32_006333 [Trebouxia sp. C0010 RCD-2024]